MKVTDLLKKLKKYSLMGASIKNSKWSEIKNRLHPTKKTICCNAPMVMLDSDDKDIGICSSCRSFGFNKNSKRRLSHNRNQSFRRIADDNLYNFEGRANNYKVMKRKNNDSE